MILSNRLPALLPEAGKHLGEGQHGAVVIIDGPVPEPGHSLGLHGAVFPRLAELNSL